MTETRAVGMDQLMLDIEDNENCGYFPIQVFETRNSPNSFRMITVNELPGHTEPHDVVGWCSSDDNYICDVTTVIISDSGSGQALMIYGGDHGIRLRPSSSNMPWNLKTGSQRGEPYLLLEIIL